MTQQRLNNPSEFQALNKYLKELYFELVAPASYPCICVYHLVSGPISIGVPPGGEYTDLEYSYIYPSDLA